MESMNPGGTGKDRAARSMILDAERRGELPPPLVNDGSNKETISENNGRDTGCGNGTTTTRQNATNNPIPSSPSNNTDSIPSNIHTAILTALANTRTHGILIEGTSGSTGISLATLSASRGHSVIVVMPDDQSYQKMELLRKLGVGVVIVKNCSISNPGHYVNVAKRIWEWIEVERRYDGYYYEHCLEPIDPSSHERHPPIRAAFMNQFENLANVNSHYTTTGPELYSQLNGKVDAFVMSAGTGGTLVGVGAYLKERWWQDQTEGTIQQQQEQPCNQQPPRIVLVDPPGSSLYNKIKHGVAYASQQSEQKLRRHRYDTLAEGIGLDRITANFGLGCDNTTANDDGSSFGKRIGMLMKDDAQDTGKPTNHPHSQKKQQPAHTNNKIINDAYSITDQQALHMAHYLLRHEGLFVGSSTAMNIVGALMVSATMPRGSNVVTVVCDGGQRHTSRFWNREFIVGERGLVWPGDDGDGGKDVNILEVLGIV